MGFEPGAPVHVSHFGKGTVREARNGGRYLVEVKGNAMVVAASELSAIEPFKPPKPRPDPSLPTRTDAASFIDLHGRTVAEAEAELDQFISDALLAGLGEVRVIHGRTGGRLKSAVHARLRQVPSVRGFFIDARNPGVTIVVL